MDHDLAGLLKRDDIMFSVAQTKGYFKQLLEGLHHLHRHNILHRDLKSSNILINNNGILKIADFGLARKFDSKQQEQGLTNRVVTLWYRPPELLLGQKHYDTKIDMWGSGCILGELFLKEELLKGSDELDQLRRISKLCGTISEENWPGVSKLPQFHIFKFPDEQRTVRERFKE
jgi:serine/threonine protein kinase